MSLIPNTTSLVFISPFKLTSSSTMAARILPTPTAGKSYAGLKSTKPKLFSARIGVPRSLRLSYLPPLSEDLIAKEIDYMLSKGWIPCLELDEVGHVHRTRCQGTMMEDIGHWKLPMLGCNNPVQILKEIRKCKKTYPNAYIRCLVFDNQH